MPKGINFIKWTDLDSALKKLGFVVGRSKIIYKRDNTRVKCGVCGKVLTRGDIGALTPEGAVCKNFACVMGVMLREKMESIGGKT